jgi:PTS system mannose-specific IIA component
MLIIMTHGDMAQGVLDSAKMIVGDIKNVKTLSLRPGMSSNELEQQLMKKINMRHKNEHVFIVVDIVGGTPCNVALKLTATVNDYSLITGLSLPMVIYYAVSNETDPEALKEGMMAEAQASIKDMHNMLMQATKSNP